MAEEMGDAAGKGVKAGVASGSGSGSGDKSSLGGGFPGTGNSLGGGGSGAKVEEKVTASGSGTAFKEVDIQTVSYCLGGGEPNS
jgi:hypothetical protein